MHEEGEEAEEEDEAKKLVARKRSREEVAAITPPTQKATVSKPIGKQGRPRSLYQFSLSPMPLATTATTLAILVFR
ncbi:hypothetical protein Hanom_Chr14g01265961 [Helianthus anomalus]